MAKVVGRKRLRERRKEGEGIGEKQVLEGGPRDETRRDVCAPMCDQFKCYV